MLAESKKTTNLLENIFYNRGPQQDFATRVRVNLCRHNVNINFSSLQLDACNFVIFHTFRFAVVVLIRCTRLSSHHRTVYYEVLHGELVCKLCSFSYATSYIDSVGVV